MLLNKMTCKWAILQHKLFILKKVPWTFPCGPASCSSILALCISWWGNFYEQDIMIKLVSVLKLTWCVCFYLLKQLLPRGSGLRFWIFHTVLHRIRGNYPSVSQSNAITHIFMSLPLVSCSMLHFDCLFTLSPSLRQWEPSVHDMIPTSRLGIE